MLGKIDLARSLQKVVAVSVWMGVGGWGVCVCQCVVK